MSEAANAADTVAGGADADTVANGGLFDAAEAAAPPAAGADGKPVRPEWLAEQFWDPEKREAKLQDLAKSQRDLRVQISRGEHKPPEKPEAYALPKVEGLPDGLIGGDKDTLWPELRAAAHAAGVTQKQMEALAAPFLREVAKVAKAQPGADPEAAKLAFTAEMQKLGPNGEALTRDLGAWMKGLASRGVLSDPEHRALRGISTAEGVRALLKLRELGGERGIPVEALGEDAMTQADAERMLAEGYQKNDEGLRRKALTALQGLEKRGLLTTR